MTDELEERINDFVDAYRYESHEGGFEPTELERVMLKDFAMKLMAEVR
jgi:hypothetical protein